MNIILSDDIPITAKPKRLSPCEQQDIANQVNEWKKENVIRDSVSPYSANALMVPKKDKTKRASTTDH